MTSHIIIHSSRRESTNKIIYLNRNMQRNLENNAWQTCSTYTKHSHLLPDYICQAHHCQVERTVHRLLYSHVFFRTVEMEITEDRSSNIDLIAESKYNHL